MKLIKIHKKNIAKMFIALILLPTFSSCTKGYDTIEEKHYSSKITESMIVELGNMHNSYLLEAFSNYNWKTNDKQKELFTSFNSVQSAKDFSITITEEPKNLDEDLLIIKKNLENQSNYRFFDESLNFIFEGKQKTVLEIETFIDIQINKAKLNSESDIDYKTFLTFSSVLKSSSKLWLDESLAGMGKFSEFKSNENGNYLAKNSDWRDCARDVLASDAAAAGAGFLIAGFFGIIEGITCPWCMLARIALASGFASGWAYYRSYNC